MLIFGGELFGKTIKSVSKHCAHQSGLALTATIRKIKKLLW